MKILVIEDNPISSKMIRIALESEGFKVVDVANGAAGLKAATAERPDLILCDLELPDVHGVDLVQRLRALPAAQKIPIVAFSAYLSPLNLEQALQAGFTDCIAKPLEPSRFLPILKSYLPWNVDISDWHVDGPTVVVADDDPVQLKLLKIRLEQAGFRVATTQDGAAALELVRQTLPDAVITDVLMPCLDGFRLCQALRQMPAAAKIPILLTSSAYLEESDKRLAEQAGANALIPRTADFRELLEELRAHFENTKDVGTECKIDPQEYSDRLSYQLDRQLAIIRDLTRRLTVRDTQLGVLENLADVFKKNSPGKLRLDDLLGCCINAAGLPKGSVFLADVNGALRLRAHLGFTADTDDIIGCSLLRSRILRDAVENGETIVMPAAYIVSDSKRETINSMAKGSVLIAPLVLGGEHLGAFVVASHDQNLDDWIGFAETVASHIAHALVLKTNFAPGRSSAEPF
jgi:CheY-like chemotaxis protein